MSDHEWTRGLPIWLSLAAVSVIAAVASYIHALAVTEAADGYTLVARCIPLLADLTIFASSANILDAYRHGERLPRLSIGSLALSILATIGSNVMAGSPQDVPSWLVNVWPPVAFMLALESLLGYYRRQTLRSAVRVTPDGVPCPHGIGMDLAESVRNAYDHARECEGDPVTFIELGAAFGLDRKTAAKLARPPVGPVETAPSNGHATRIPELSGGPADG